MADQHPKFYTPRPRGLADIMDTPFQELWQWVETATPSNDKMLKNERFGNSRHELLEFTLMKMEDLIPFDEEEPWMSAVDPADEEGLAGPAEIRVQFDHNVFWKGQAEPDLVAVREENSLIPKTGYFSCREFMANPEREFGIKRYTLFKPDGTRSKI